MEKNDLRPGNWIEYYITEIETYDYKVVESNLDIHNNSHIYRPINITKEILIESLGFQEWFDKELNQKVVSLDAWCIGHYARFDMDFRGIDKFYLKSRYDEQSIVLDAQELPHIKYIHQIQNLYYMLTGCELEIIKPIE